MVEATGTVRTFDDAAGYGTVTDDDGADWFFHCTAIADGSRTIDERARVRFRLTAGRLGRWEATAVRPLDATEP
jgi:cold shock CspA family protein